MNKLLDEYAMAERLSVSVSFLQKDRRKARTIPFIQLGKAVRYDPEAVSVAMAALQQGGDATARQKRRAVQ